MTCIARIELHENFPGDKIDYDLFHAELALVHFGKEINLNGQIELLPTGTYARTVPGSMLQMDSQIRWAAQKVGHRVEAVLTRNSEIHTIQLQVVRGRLPATPLGTAIMAAPLAPHPLAKLGMPIRFGTSPDYSAWESFRSNK